MNLSETELREGLVLGVGLGLELGIFTSFMEGLEVHCRWTFIPGVDALDRARHLALVADLACEL